MSTPPRPPRVPPPAEFLGYNADTYSFPQALYEFLEIVPRAKWGIATAGVAPRPSCTSFERAMQVPKKKTIPTQVRKITETCVASVLPPFPSLSRFGGFRALAPQAICYAVCWYPLSKSGIMESKKICGVVKSTSLLRLLITR